MLEDEPDDNTRKPYYLENFLEIVNYITKNKEFSLLDADDLGRVDRFNNLSYDAKILYVRLLTRKRRWILVKTLTIKEIDMELALNELTEINFLDKSYQNSEENRTDLKSLLKLLNLAQIRSLYKQQFPISPKHNGKEDIIKQILTLSAKTSYFVAKNKLYDTLVTKCQKLLGNCVILTQEPMDTFLSLLLLYSLPMSLYEKLEERKNLLYQMLLVKIGRVSYAPYTIPYEVNDPIFPSRHNFLHFKALLDDYTGVLEHFEKKKYRECILLYQQTFLVIHRIFKNVSQPTGHHTQKIEFDLNYSTDNSKDPEDEVEVIGVVKPKLTPEVKVKIGQELDTETVLAKHLENLNNMDGLVDEKVRITRMSPFLRKYSAYAIFLRIESFVAECYQKLKMYKQAAVVLRHLLDNVEIVVHRRGHWYLRLALVTENYLKDHKGALAVIKEALDDKYVRTGYRLAIYERYLNLCPKCNQRMEFRPDMETEQIKKIYISGKLLPKPNAMGKSIFISTTHHRPSIESSVSLLGGEESNDNSSLTSSMGDFEPRQSHPSTSLCSVESLAIDHYLRYGFTNGIHGEGSIFSTLTSLYFWDEIFAPGIPNTFRNMLQSCPLDWEHDEFYVSRKEQIDEKLDRLLSNCLEVELSTSECSDTSSKKISDQTAIRADNSRGEMGGGDPVKEEFVGKMMGGDTLKYAKGGENLLDDGAPRDTTSDRQSMLEQIIASKWDDLYGTPKHDDNSAKLAPVHFPGLNWDIFGTEDGKGRALSLLKATGPQVFGKIAERLIKDHRHTRGGFPDLTLWNKDTNTLKIVEVKGPGDRLSHKQILWLNFLTSIGVDCEVCHVTSTSSKRQRT